MLEHLAGSTLSLTMLASPAGTVPWDPKKPSRSWSYHAGSLLPLTRNPVEAPWWVWRKRPNWRGRAAPWGLYLSFDSSIGSWRIFYSGFSTDTETEPDLHSSLPVFSFVGQSSQQNSRRQAFSPGRIQKSGHLSGYLSRYLICTISSELSCWREQVSLNPAFEQLSALGVRMTAPDALPSIFACSH